MRKSLFENDPIISTLFKAITTQYVPPAEKYYRFTATYVRTFLGSLGVSNPGVEKIITELFKDIKFLSSLHERIRKLKSSESHEETAIFYLTRLQSQTAYTIAEKILKDDSEENSMRLYAKLQVLRKFQERCGSPELFSLIAKALSDSYHVRECSFHTLCEGDLDKDADGMPCTVINISDFMSAAPIE